MDYAGTGTYPLKLERTYNSGGIAPASVSLAGWGSQWRGSYDRSISSITAGQFNAIRLTRTDGKQYSFNLVGTVSRADDPDIIGTLIETGVDVSGNATGWTYRNERDEVETYDVAGKLLSLTNQAGLVQTLTYSDGSAVTPNGGYVLSAAGLATATVLPAGRLIRVTDPAGRNLQFGYDASGRVVKAVDPAGGVYLYAYSGLLLTDNLTSVTYPDGKVRTYLYGEAANVSATPETGVSYAHALTGIVDENGTRYASWTHDAQGRATSSEHGTFGSGIDHVGLVYTAPDANGNSTTAVTDPRGTTRTYNFSTILGVVKNTGISGLPCNGCSAAFTYDANGNVASRTDFKGNKTTYIYDLTRNLETSRTEATGTAVARTITTQWHATLRLPTLISEPGRTTAYAYDPTTGNLLSRTVTDTASNTSRIWTYSYTTAADLTLPNLLKSINGPRTDVTDISTYGYYPNGDLKTISDALNHITTITSVDANGRPLTLTDPNGVVTTMSYTPRGWLKSRSVGTLTTNYTYDGVGQLTRVTLPDTSHLDYTYDAAHRLTDISNAKLDHLHYTLDAMGNRIKEDVYDAAGKLSQTHSRTFDALNRLAQDISAYNATTSHTTNYSYDANGDLTQVVDAKNNATVIGYDALSRISRSTDAALGITDYSYDGVDQLTNVNDPKTFNTHYALNTLGDENQLNSPDSGITNRSFDSAGNLAAATDARGIAATYTWDALNRPLAINYPSLAENMSYTWDAASGCSNGIGRICQLTDSNGSTTFAYDDQGNLTKRTRSVFGVGYTTQYVYDAANRLITVITPGGETVSMVRDAAGYIQQVDDTTAMGTSSITANVQYDGTGQATSQKLGNGAVQNGGYTLSGQSGGGNLVRPLNPVDIDANTVRLFIAGSYLKQSLLEPALRDLMQPGSLSVFHDGTVNAGVGIASGQNHRAYFGVVNDTALNVPIPANLSGKKVLVVDRSQGDSIYGVIPLAKATAISALSVDNACAPTGQTDGSGLWLWACPNTVNAVPDAGLSDVEPALMASAVNFNPASGIWLGNSDLANLNTSTLLGQGIGIAVNGSVTQGSATPATATMLNLSKAQIIGLMGGGIFDWNMIDPTLPVGSTSLVVCRAQAGAGTQAAINATLFGSPCMSSPLYAQAYSSTSAPMGSTAPVAAGNVIFVENASPDAVARCMTVAQNGNAAGEAINLTTGAIVAAGSPNTVVLPAGNYAIGVMSLNRPARTGELYQFVTLNGAAAPTLENASTGMYDLITESVLLRRHAATAGIPAMSGSQLALYDTLANIIGNPTFLSQLPGLAALSENAWVSGNGTQANSGWDPANPVLRVGNFGHSCSPLIQLQ